MNFWTIAAASAAYAIFIIGFVIGSRRFEDEDIAPYKDTYHEEDKPDVKS